MLTRAAPLIEMRKGGRLWARARSVLSSTPFLGVAVALASWNVAAFGVPAAGLDYSWQAGLSMATHQGLDFGSQVVWTYGPLGFLAIPFAFYGGLASLHFAYSSIVHLAFCLSLVWALRRTFGAAIAVVATFVTAVVFSPMDWVVVLAALWCFAAISEDVPPFARWLVVFGGGVVAALELLLKLNPGLPVAALFAITVCVMDGRQRKRSIPLFAGTFAVCLIALWIGSGQELSGVGAYVRSSAQVIGGYSDAMGAEGGGLTWQLPAGAAAIAILVFVTLAPTRDLRWSRRAILLLMLGVVMFPIYKEGFVRHDENHAAIFFATTLGIGLAILPMLERRWLAGPAIVALAIPAVAALPPATAGSANPIDHLDSLASQVRTVLSPERRDVPTAFGKAFMSETYGLDRRTLGLLRGHAVHVDPWEAGVAWAYGLDWSPLPVFQDYSAYTAELDEMNASALESPDGPDRILRENTAVVDPAYPSPTIDGRYPAWDPPGSAVAMLCNFEALRTTSRWQVLGRVNDRCGTQRLIRSIPTRFGETVEVPEARHPNEVVIAAIHGADVEGIERLRALTFRAKSRYVVINGIETYRLVPGTAADGLLVDTPCSLDYPRPFALGPRARTITLQEGGSQDPLQVDFYAMRVRPSAGARIEACARRPAR